MNQSKITIRYAKALFDLSLERKVLERVKDDMALLDKVCHESPDLTRMLHSPVINVDKKHKVMHKIFESSMDKLTMNFIDIISRKRREYYIDGIASAFVSLYKEYIGLKTAYITTAIPLAEADKAGVMAILRTLTGKDIELVEKLKSEIIGGFILEMDNYQVDQSVTAKFKELRKDFDKNLYVKGF